MKIALPVQRAAINLDPTATRSCQPPTSRSPSSNRTMRRPVAVTCNWGTLGSGSSPTSRSPASASATSEPVELTRDREHRQCPAFTPSHMQADRRLCPHRRSTAESLNSGTVHTAAIHPAATRAAVKTSSGMGWSSFQVIAIGRSPVWLT